MNDPSELVPWIPLAGYGAKGLWDAFLARKKKLEDQVEAAALDASMKQTKQLEEVLLILNEQTADMRLMQKDLDALKTVPDRLTALERDVATLKSRPAGRGKK